MDALMIVALVLQIFLLFMIVGVWVALAIMPGRIARKRGHPQAESINVCGWIGAVTMGVFSPIAFIWAFSRPVLKPIDWVPADSPDRPEAEAEQEAES